MNTWIYTLWKADYWHKLMYFWEQKFELKRLNSDSFLEMQCTR